MQMSPPPDDAQLARLALENEMKLWSRAVTVIPGGAARRVEAG